jgi:hypothetical protein
MMTTTTLKLLDMKCVKRQDTVGKDTVRILVNGSTPSGPHFMVTGGEITLNSSYNFSNGEPAKIHLWEQDGPNFDPHEDKNDDDYLGEVIVPATPTTNPDRVTVNFNRLSGAFYEVTYTVVQTA